MNQFKKIKKTIQRGYFTVELAYVVHNFEHCTTE